MRKSGRVLSLLGPAFVAAIAYVDPGNFAANFSAGAQYGYLLLWVLVVANVMASIVQYLSAKVGIITGQSLPEVIAQKLSKRYRIMYWLQAEGVAIATDIAEVMGGAIAFGLLFHIPLVAGGIITGIVSLALLGLQSRFQQKYFERIVIGMLLVIPIGLIAGLVLAPPNVSQSLNGLVPRLQGKETVLLAVAMLGATIMPHVVYLHSALARDRHGKVPSERVKRLLRVTQIDVTLAMLIAGGVNIAMLLLAASVLRGNSNTGSLSGVFSELSSHISPVVGILFAIGLLVSGFASTAVGSHAGSVIMEGFLGHTIGPFLRRLIVIIPTIILLVWGTDPTRALLLSQVVLSFGIPFALIPLGIVTSNRKLMKEAVNTRKTTIGIYGITTVVVVLNGILIWLSFKGSI